jgi:two-component sensor histidine kinase
MDRLGRFDVPSRLAPGVPAWLSQIACSALSVAVIVLLRRGIDAVLPDVAPFVLLSPGVLLATSLAGWRAGVLTLVLAEILIWQFLLPEGFNVLRASDAATLILNTVAALLVIGVAQAFRVASRAALQARSAELATRELLFRELDHRVKNGFAIIASLLALQRRQETEPAAQAALDQVAQRINGIARAHNDLYRVSTDEKNVDLGAYLRDLCGNLGKALFPTGAVALQCDAERTPMDRDRVVAIGLIVNELVTNAAKYAFDGRDDAHVSVSLKRNDRGWRLIVADNGRGLPPDFDQRGGLGRGLIQAFAKQARATLSVSSNSGAVFQLDLEA